MSRSRQLVEEVAELFCMEPDRRTVPRKKTFVEVGDQVYADSAWEEGMKLVKTAPAMTSEMYFANLRPICPASQLGVLLMVCKSYNCHIYEAELLSTLEQRAGRFVSYHACWRVTIQRSSFLFSPVLSPKIKQFLAMRIGEMGFSQLLLRDSSRAMKLLSLVVTYRFHQSRMPRHQACLTCTMLASPFSLLRTFLYNCHIYWYTTRQIGINYGYSATA
jgi:hypothetical protein